MTINRQWIFASRPQGMVGPANFEYRETPLSNAPLEPGDVLVRNKTFSLIPAQRTWMNADSEYFPPIPVGAAVSAPATGEVVQSANPRFPVGMRVTGLTRWEDYSLMKADRLTISPLPADVDLLDALSVFGGNALTAYLGLLKIGTPKPGETVVVSGAAGSTGSMAVQIARIVGCKAIGIAGGPAKCEWLRTEAKVEAIDYKHENVADRLKALAPQGVNVFFDNVGGVIMQDVIDQMAMHGRAVICGQIAHYNTGTAPGPRNMFRVVSHRLRIQGFIAGDLMADREEALRDLRQWAKAGQLAHKTDVRSGFKNLPTVFGELFTGGNDGTLILMVD
jgi:NADPH-dependent curcumin reductase CurA